MVGFEDCLRTPRWEFSAPGPRSELLGGAKRQKQATLSHWWVSTTSTARSDRTELQACSAM